MEILVSGALRGLGACLTKRLLAGGHTVYAVVLPGRGSGELADVQDNPALTIIPADIGNQAGIEAAAATVAQKTGVLDALVNVAGVLRNKQGTILEDTYEDLHTTFAVNTIAPVYLTSRCMPLLEKSPAPVVLTVCSEVRAIDDVGDWFPAYCMSKTAATQFCFSLAATLAKAGPACRVHAVHPGRMRTAMGGDNSEIDPEESAEGLAALVEGTMRPDEVYIDWRGNPMLPGKTGGSV